MRPTLRNVWGCAVRRFVALGAAFLLLPAATLAQDSADTLMRAAYCAGVLKHDLDRIRTSNIEADQTRCRPGQTIEECSKVDPFMGSLLAQLEKDAVDRRNRYTEYIRFRMTEISPARKEALLSLTRKGETDSARKLTEKLADATNPAVDLCHAAKLSRPALVDCIAQHDQVLANLLRCRTMPDQLPF